MSIRTSIVTICICDADPNSLQPHEFYILLRLYMETSYICVNTEDEASIQAGIQWWLDLTGTGGEGMVVKSETFIAKQNGTLLQPAVKCRGSEYLRIIYGAEYLEPNHL